MTDVNRFFAFDFFFNLPAATDEPQIALFEGLLQVAVRSHLGIVTGVAPARTWQVPVPACPDHRLIAYTLEIREYEPLRGLRLLQVWDGLARALGITSGAQ